MGLRSSFTKSTKDDTTQNSNLSIQELEFLLVVIKQISFKGEDVEMLYNIVSKIQQQHIQNQNK